MRTEIVFPSQVEPNDRLLIDVLTRKVHSND